MMEEELRAPFNWSLDRKIAYALEKHEKLIVKNPEIAKLWKTAIELLEKKRECN
jgi:hypothetical protein